MYVFSLSVRGCSGTTQGSVWQAGRTEAPDATGTTAAVIELKETLTLP